LSPPPYSQHSAPLRHLCSFPTRRSSDLLPVSDLTTVLSKVTIPLVVLPLVAFVMVVSVQLIMLMMTSANLIFHGMSPASTWAHVPFFQNWVVLLYGLVAIALWYMPIYGWLLLVSVWARRATFLWAVLPLLA